MDVDSQPMMEETILVGDDLMMGPPSPLIPPEIASHVLEGVDLCDGILRNMFLCLQINDIEPFCQDEIVLYRQCAEKRDKELRQRLQDSEHKLGLSMPLDEAKERAAQLESESTSLERAEDNEEESRAASEASRHVKRDFSDQLRRGMLVTHSGNDTSFVGATCEGVKEFFFASKFSGRLILASGVEGMEGFRQRWSLHGRLTDTKKRLESLKQGMEKRKEDEPVGGSSMKRWFFW